MSDYLPLVMAGIALLSALTNVRVKKAPMKLEKLK